MKKIAVLGSTGSIGTQTLDIVRNNKEDLEVRIERAGICNPLKPVEEKSLDIGYNEKKKLQKYIDHLVLYQLIPLF